MKPILQKDNLTERQPKSKKTFKKGNLIQKTEILTERQTYRKTTLHRDNLTERQTYKGDDLRKRQPHGKTASQRIKC